MRLKYFSWVNVNFFYLSYKTATTDPDNAKFGTFKESEKYLRDKNFELERYNAELELKLEDGDREAARLRAETRSLEAEIKTERAKTVSGEYPSLSSLFGVVSSFTIYHVDC